MTQHLEPTLTLAQRAACEAVRARGGEPDGELADLATVIERHAYVTLNFHPYRRLAGGQSVAEGLLADGIYRGQFETGVSNGSATAFPGGERERWEKSLFEGAYCDAPATDRPKYGALALMRHPDGASPRFGCCYLRLRQSVSSRCTFTWGDSHLGPAHVGTIDALSRVLDAMFDDVRARGATLGVSPLTAEDLRTRLLQGLVSPAADNPARYPPGRALDEYIEAQVHGPVDLHRDVEALVADASLRNTETGAVLAEVARRYRVGLLWHRGFRLAPDGIPDAFRGPRVPELARKLSTSAVDASVLADAARSMREDPTRWRNWASPEDTLQHLKQLWHCLVAFGDPVLGSP